MSASEVVLSACDVSRTFGGHRRSTAPAVDGATVTLSPGMAVGLIGGSGSGKSTLARMLVGLEPPTRGLVTFNGTEVRSLLRKRDQRLAFRRAVQFVSQDTTSSFDPRRRLRDALRQPLLRLRDTGGREAADRIEATLASLGLDPAMADRYPHEVSGGQRQRMALARALVVRPRLLVCDEVVSALDVSVQGAVLNMLKTYCETEEAGLLFVSHGLPATAFIATTLIVMERGHIVDHGSVETILQGGGHPFTRRMVAAYQIGGGGAGRPSEPVEV